MIENILGKFFKSEEHSKFMEVSRFQTKNIRSY